MKKIAILASGNGSNAENIIRHFQNHINIKIVLVGSNNNKAKVLKRVKKYNIPTFVFSKEDLNSTRLLTELNKKKVNFIVLAGFLLKIPLHILKKYKKKIINIHPSLLPLYGGKGMYGTRVHEKVVENKEKETGITIHLVNDEYDAGKIIFQAKCPLATSTTVKRLAKKVHELEMKFYPKIIENILNENN